MVKIKIEVNNKDISKNFKENFISLEIIDRDGNATDELNLEIANKIKRPSYDDVIKIWIDSVFYGSFSVQESKTNHENTIEIRATGTNFQKELKVKRNKSWKKTTLNKILKEKSLSHSLNFKGLKEDIAITSIIQSNESDLHFLNRLAKEFDTIFSVKNNTLLFINRTEKLPFFTVNVTQCSAYSIGDVAKKRYDSCKAIWRDTKENKTLSITVGDNAPTITINGSFKSKEEAKKKAVAKLARTNRGTKRGTLSKRGEYFSAGGLLNITNSKQDDGLYSIETVYTRIDPSDGHRVVLEFQN